MAKGLGGGVPIGAVLAADTCCNVLTPGTHATTFGGTPMVCAAANAVLDNVGDPKFLHEVKQKGEYLKNGILALGKDSIHGVRGMGLMLGIIVDEGKHSAYANKLIENGVLAMHRGQECSPPASAARYLQGRNGRSTVRLWPRYSDKRVRSGGQGCPHRAAVESSGIPISCGGLRAARPTIVINFHPDRKVFLQ